MGTINFVRMAIGTVPAGIVFFIGDAIVNGGVLKTQWSAILSPISLTADEAFAHPGYFASYDFLKALLALWIYAAIRPRFGAGPSTALIAALTVWLLVLPIPMIGILPMRFLPARFVTIWSLLALVPIIMGTLAGAWLYAE